MDCSGEMKEKIFYVSCEGSDAWSGDLRESNRDKTDGPVRTLERAKAVTRELKSGGRQESPVRILVRGGFYLLDKPLFFRPEDSGSDESTVSYEAYPGEKPVISGGRRIESWEPAGGGLWKAVIPADAAAKPPFRQLFVNGERRCRARLPAENSYFEIRDIPDPENPDGEINRTTFSFSPGDIKESFNFEEAEIVVLYRWSTGRLLVESIDFENSIVKLKGSNRRPFSRALRYYIDNVPEGLDTPGAWYFDRRERALFYRPLQGENMRESEVFAPYLEHLLVLEGNPARAEYVSNLSFRGFSFRHTEWEMPPGGFLYCSQAACGNPYVKAAVTAAGARSCSISDNEIMHTGGYAVDFSRGCSGNRICRNHVHDTGAGGIKVGECEDRESPSDMTFGNYVSDNRVHGGGKVMMDGVGIWIGKSGSNRVCHNEIFDMYYSGISVGWSWNFEISPARGNIIEYNHIHDVMKNTLSDGGGIYTLGLSPGTVVRNNIIHDVRAFEQYSGRGIYLDEGSSGIVVENNIVYNTSGPCIRLQVKTLSNIIINNIFAFGEEAQVCFDTDRANVFEYNIIYWEEGRLFRRPNWENYDRIHNYNLYFKASGSPLRFFEYTFDEWKQKGGKPGLNPKKDKGNMDENSIIADPMFAGAEEGDFRLKSGSPALALGFKQIDFENAGPRTW